MSNVEKPPEWTDEQFAAFFGSADDPIQDQPVFESTEILDLYAGYDAAANAEHGGEQA
jgi:hypothetical protein